jgi:hypothetical protein
VGLSGADGNVQQPLGELRSAILTETAKSIFTIAGGLVAAAAVVFLLAPADVSDDPGT